jgi:para-nitrobenzyl esterase
MAVVSALGIRYGVAARWNAAELVDDGALDSYGPSCPQPAEWFGRLLPGRAAEAQSEDCLYLNVWAPAGGAAGRPVLVWLHGGLFAVGSGSWPMYAGDRLAAATGCVVVTVNHRLDVFGFLHPTEELSHAGFVPDVGLLDLVTALRWVRENIQRFGGDAGNVTVFGQSGGGGKVAMLLVMPDARGLFHRAVVQSGARLRAADRGSAERATAGLLDVLGLRPHDAAALLEVPAEALVAASTELARRTRVVRGGPFLPSIAPDVLPAHPLDAVGAGSARGIPLLIGFASDEATLLHAMDGLDPRDDASVEARTRGLGLDAAGYRSGHPELDAYEALVALETEQWRRADSLRLADAQSPHAPTYVYEFAWPKLGALRATHGVELPFVFQRVGEVDDLRYEWERMISTDRADDPDVALQQLVGQAWSAFARDGEPSAAGGPAWPRRSTGRHIVLDTDVRVVSTQL